MRIDLLDKVSEDAIVISLIVGSLSMFDPSRNKYLNKYNRLLLQHGNDLPISIDEVNSKLSRICTSLEINIEEEEFWRIMSSYILLFVGFKHTKENALSNAKKHIKQLKIDKKYHQDQIEKAKILKDKVNFVTSPVSHKLIPIKSKDEQLSIALAFHGPCIDLLRVEIEFLTEIRTTISAAGNNTKPNHWHPLVKKDSDWVDLFYGICDQLQIDLGHLDKTMVARAIHCMKGTPGPKNIDSSNIYKHVKTWKPTNNKQLNQSIESYFKNMDHNMD